MKIQINTRGAIPIIVVIAILIVLGGIGAILIYTISNQNNLNTEAEEIHEQRTQQAQENGYPSVWIEDNLPKYPNAKLTKTREGKTGSSWGAQITLETQDSLTEIKNFFTSEMSTRGYTDAFAHMPINEFSAMGQYQNGQATLSLQATQLGNGPKNKVILIYSDQAHTD